MRCAECALNRIKLVQGCVNLGACIINTLVNNMGKKTPDDEHRHAINNCKIAELNKNTAEAESNIVIIV